MRSRAAVFTCAVAMIGSGCVPAAMSGRGADGIAAATDEAVPARLIARGTEPFWAVETDSDRLVWRTPGHPEGTAVPVVRRVREDGVRYIARDGAAFELVVMPGRCSDGMSDLVYPFKATWTHDGRVRRGCALSRE